MTVAKGAVCSIRGCRGRKVAGLRWCQKHAVERCDDLFRDIIRGRGFCESGRPEHKGVHQTAHGFSRRYLAVRWDERNAFCFCAGCHVYFTHRPIEWDLWMRDRMGEALYLELRDLAIDTTVKVDIEDAFSLLKAAA